MKPLRDDSESAKERAVRVMATGWCPWPYLRATAPGDVGLDYKAECRCGKRVRVTARGHALLKVTRNADAFEKSAGRPAPSRDVAARHAFQADMWDAINRTEKVP